MKDENNNHFQYLPYNISLNKMARENRKNPTPAEKKIWYEILKQKQFQKYKFLRQKPINNFIVDFYCSKLGLVIEVDGDSHIDKEEYDDERTKILSAYGLTVIRYSNDEVLNNIDGVYEDLINKMTHLKINFSPDKGR